MWLTSLEEVVMFMPMEMIVMATMGIALFLAAGVLADLYACGSR